MSTTPYQLPYSNPENVVSAAPNTIFRREGNKFSLKQGNTITELSISNKAFAINYRNQVGDAVPDDVVTFEKPRENWIKTGTTTGKTGWVYLNDKNQQPSATDQIVPLFFTNSSNYSYRRQVSSSYIVSLIYTGSIENGDTFVLDVSSSSPNWYFSGSRIVTAGSITGPSYGSTSSNGSPWKILHTSSVATSNLLIIDAEFKYDGTPNVTGSVTFHSDLYISGSFQNSHKFVITSGSA